MNENPWSRLPSSPPFVLPAVKRKAVIVRMRKNERWFKEVPGLKEHDRLYQVKNWQNPAISENNCDGFKEIVQAIQAAEAKG